MRGRETPTRVSGLMVLQVLHCPHCHGTDIVRQMSGMPRAWAHVSPGVYLCRSIGCDQGTDHRHGDECQWHSRYRTGVTRQSEHSPERIKKKEPALQQVNKAALKCLFPGHVEVEICRADELAQRRGLASELDEMWSYVGKEVEPRWLWSRANILTCGPGSNGLYGAPFAFPKR